MKIKFISHIDQMGTKNEIAFTSEVTISQWNEFQVYEFLEPKNNVMNRIEVSSNAINIFAGTASIQLVLHQEIKTEYQVPSGTVFFKARLNKLEREENEINFSYQLNAINGDLIGEYDIKLIIQ